MFEFINYILEYCGNNLNSNTINLFENSYSSKKYTNISKHNNNNNEYNYDTKQYKYDKKYLEITEKIAELSYAERKKVGSIIVKNSVIISDGFNGTPKGFENDCEDNLGDTKWYTLHSEANAITKLVRTGGVSAEGSTLYITLSPCKECAKLILQSGISRVIYKEEYRDKVGINFLKSAGIEICQFTEENN